MDADIRDAVRARYADVAGPTGKTPCCGDGADRSCCGGAASAAFGYSVDELASLPDGADLSLGCGNPTAIAGIAPGEVVVDLGSGAGIDCFLAARRVGPSGRVIGVDMTPEMILRARANAARSGVSTVEFRLGEIENLPVADAQADLVISNCVINLSPDKPRVLAEAFRVLKPGGRLAVSDLVLTAPLDASMRENVALLTGCIAGAMVLEEFLQAIRQARFGEVRVERTSHYIAVEDARELARDAGIDEDAARRIAERVRSVSVIARKGAP